MFNRANLLISEKKSLFNFLTLYSVFIIILITLSSILYYNSERTQMLQNKQFIMQNYAYEFIDKLKLLHRNFDKMQHYPRDYRFESAIYDSDHQRIFSTLKKHPKKRDKTIFIYQKHIYFLKSLESYYLGTKYLLLEMPEDTQWLIQVRKNIMIYSIIIFGISLFIGYLLARLFLKPMREAIVLLDRFIKDTTHELNTPINTMLANIEMIEDLPMDIKISKKFNRIKIASKTISNLYQDLTYATLNHKIISHNTNLELSPIIKERIEFFNTMAQSKKISFSLTLEKDIYLFIDQKKFIKLFDNLISNAIKYNHINGFINISLAEGVLSVEDNGIGIPEDKQIDVFKRYQRYNTATGGFGIGLSIVLAIVKEYNMDIAITSKHQEGTKVTLQW